MANFDIYSMITERILAEMETGVIPWDRPWTGCADGAFSGASGRPYSLLNQMLLRKPGAWFTWQEIQRRGGHVKKGEKARMIIFWKLYEDVDQETGEITQKPFLRYYKVFHIDQCEGISPRFDQSHDPGNDLKPDEKADKRILEEHLQVRLES